MANYVKYPEGWDFYNDRPAKENPMSHKDMTSLRSSQGNLPSEHTPGPWRTRDALVLFPNGAGGFSLQNCPVAHANARRIVACVNACEGLANPEEYIRPFRAGALEVEAERNQLRERVAELVATLKGASEAIRSARGFMIDDYNKALASELADKCDAVLANERP